MHLVTLFTCFILHSAPINAANTASIDTSRYAILPFNKSRDSFIFNKDFKPTTVSAKLQELEYAQAMNAGQSPNGQPAGTPSSTPAGRR